MVHADLWTAEISMWNKALWFMQTCRQQRFLCGVKHSGSCRHADSGDFNVGWSIMVHADMWTAEISIWDEALWFMQIFGQWRFQCGMKHYLMMVHAGIQTAEICQCGMNHYNLCQCGMNHYNLCRHTDSTDIQCWMNQWLWFMQTYRQHRFLSGMNHYNLCRHTDSRDVFQCGMNQWLWFMQTNGQQRFQCGTKHCGSCRYTDSGERKEERKKK